MGVCNIGKIRGLPYTWGKACLPPQHVENPLAPLAPQLVADQLRLDYPGGVTALRDLTLRVPAGQFVSVLGPSGCGKSTLLRLMGGLINSSEGILTVDGQPPSMARQRSAKMSFVFQDATLLPWRTVIGNVRLPLELLRQPAAEQQVKAINATELVGLAEFATRYPRELSGGMRMRASLARALVTQPKVLLLDEPFGALDDITRSQLNEDLLNLWQRNGWTAVFVTHNIAEAVFLSQRVIVMSPRPGRVVADIPVSLPSTRNAALRASADFARLAGEVSEQLRKACA